MISLLSDLTTEEGLKALNEYLKDKSYMHGYCVSQSDITVFISIKQSLDPKLYPHLHRWHKHIKVVGGDITKPPNFIKHEGQECKILKENISYKSPKKEQAMKTDNSRTESQDSLVDNSDVVSEKELRNIKDDKDYDSQVYPTEISNIYTILLEIKPKDEEVDMKELESLVRGVDLEGLKWGASQTTPIAYGIHKLSIICTLEDDRSSMQDVLQRLVKYENYVRDVNIAAFNKL
ncbi:UNVERIFIED_CONTAM: hypothetical protein RMT77_007188 [Armadillidium vulgare]